ncbi:MAG TPA: Wzz/FepE/Etk N-terminal domain-containing protein, partial [Acidimicrobiales bacterium]|nr:Wzz/FepE/Etk N-terminal domain-containing protein [Acidimicrobiales bacterium]
MIEQPMDLRAFLRALRRRRLAVVALVLLGLFGGTAYTVLMPPMQKASALVIVPASATAGSGATPAQANATQIVIARSLPVLSAAGASVSPPLSYTAARKRVDVSALSDTVLQVEASGTTARDALALANAAANDYVAYTDRTATAASTGAVAGLKKEAAQLTHQVESLQRQIDAVTRRLGHEKASTYAGERDAALLANLGSSQQAVSLDLNNVSSQIVAAQLSSSELAGSTRVLQAALTVPGSIGSQVLFPLAGAVAGLLGGLLVVVLWARSDRRIRSRDELAVAIGAPVVASSSAGPCRSAKDWRTLVEKYEPSTVETWNARKVLGRLGISDADRFGRFTIFTCDGDQAAIAASVQLVKACAGLGGQVALEAAEVPCLALLRAACTTTGLVEVNGSVTVPSRLANLEQVANRRLIVGLVPVGTTAANSHGGHLSAGGPSLICVSSGFAGEELLAKVALSAADAGTNLAGAIMVNPEPGDST